MVGSIEGILQVGDIGREVSVEWDLALKAENIWCSEDLFLPLHHNYKVPWPIG